MRAFNAAIAVLTLVPSLGLAADKLTFEDRIELTRGLTAEYANAKVVLPRSRKALEVGTDGTYDKSSWSESLRTNGPAARVGDTVQITKLVIQDDRLILEINGGINGGRKWYHGIQIAGGTGNGGTPVPISEQPVSNAPGGTTLALVFHKPLEPIKAAEVKKFLASVLDFDRRSATEIYSETLPPEVKAAIREKRAMVGMDKEQVILAMGRPAHKSRETADGLEVEDWVFGTPPGKITFVTFDGNKVIKVKEAYAGLGSEVADPPVVR